MSRRIFFLFLVALSLTSCGKRTPLSFKDYEPPAAPKKLSALLRQNTLILNWTYPESAKIKGFLVESREDGGPFRQLVFTKEHFYATRVEFGMHYTYSVRAKSIEDIYSPRALIALNAVAPPPAPAGLNFRIGNNSVTLSWQARERAVFNVYRKIGDEDYSLLTPTPIKERSFKDAPVPDSVVTYQIRPLTPGNTPNEGKWADIEVKPQDYVPARPAKPIAVSLDNAVGLVWQPNPESWIRGYRVYKETDDKIEPIGETSIPSFFYKGPKGGLYMVSALGPKLESPLSEPARP